jgi:hypothetical protein
LNPIATGLIAFACSSGGIIAGLLIRSRLPGHHISPESKEAVKLGSGLLATLTALVLGLLVSSAKSTFDTMNSGLTQGGAKVIVLDRTMAQYGPETKVARDVLRRTIAAGIRKIWPEDKSDASGMKDFETGPVGLEVVQKELRGLVPQNDTQKAIQSEAVGIANELMQARWLAIEQAQNSLPTAFLVVLLFWLTAFFITLGLLAPPNGTVVTVLVVCALSMGGAIYLVGEMNRPLQGTMKLSSAPLVKALEHLGKD